MWPFASTFGFNWWIPAKLSGEPVCQPRKIGAKQPRHIPEPNRPRSGKRRRCWQ